MNNDENLQLLLAAIKRLVENNCINTAGLLILLPVLLKANSEIK